MYVTHKPEDHTPWNDKNRHGKKDKSNDSPKSIQQSSGNGGKKKSLTLNNKMKAAMIARFKCSTEEAAVFLQSVEYETGN